jgi:DNA invertase Pin-like site-specific DNA recombinase
MSSRDTFELLFEAEAEERRRNGKRPKKIARRAAGVARKKNAHGKQHTRGRRVTPATIARIQRLKGQGKSFSQIAAATGVSWPTARQYATAKPARTSGAPAVAEKKTAPSRPSLVP